MTTTTPEEAASSSMVQEELHQTQDAHDEQSFPETDVSKDLSMSMTNQNEPQQK